MGLSDNVGLMNFTEAWAIKNNNSGVCGELLPATLKSTPTLEPSPWIHLQYPNTNFSLKVNLPIFPQPPHSCYNPITWIKLMNY